MNLPLEAIPWDSEFLGYGVGRLQPETTATAPLQELVAEARRADYRLLYWSVSPDDAQAAATAQAIGAVLVDRKITYAMSVAADSATRVLSAGIELATRTTSRLISLAMQAGHQSRFQIDPHFAPDMYERLYTRWVENSVNGFLAREVLVYHTQECANEIGMMTLGLKKGRVDIGLLAVEANMRGQSIGAHLVEAAQQRTRLWGFDMLQVVTQLTNVGACVFYERCGFTPDLLENVYHIWL